MISKKNVVLLMSLNCLQTFGMSGPLAWASAIFSTEKPKSVSPKSAAAKKAADEQQKAENDAQAAHKIVIDGAFKRLKAAQDKLNKVAGKKRSAGFKVSVAADDYLEGDLLDFTAYSKVATAQKKRASLSTTYADEAVTEKEYEEALSVYQKAQDDYYFAKTGIKTNTAPLAYEPPPFIPAKPQVPGSAVHAIQAGTSN